MRREEERVSSSYHRGKSRKPKSAKDTGEQKQGQGKELDYQTTAKKDVEKKGNVPVAGEQSLDEEVREKPAPKSHRQKEEQTKSESKDESSFTSTSDDQSELHLYKSTRMKKHHKVHANTGGNEIEKEMAVKTKKKTKVTKQKGFCSSDMDMREQSKEVKTSTKVNQKAKKTSKEKYLKAGDTSPRKEREELVSEDEESDSDDSSEDKKDRDSEQKSSNEEEETEPDDESSPDTSEEEVKRKPVVPYMKEREKETGGRKGEQVMMTADVQDLQGGEDQSDPDRDQEEDDIQPKKRSRRRHRKSSMSHTTRGSSSPSTSQNQVDSKEQNGKNEKGKDHKKKGKPKRKEEASDSSPECDRSSESEKLKINVFEYFYGQLCCEISNPVETAAQLQKKGLISKAVMRDMMRSPESQQEKSINLVDKLDEIIKSQPDCLFTFIEVLLENDALQKVDSEILTAAGNYKIELILNLF